MTEVPLCVLSFVHLEHRDTFGRIRAIRGRHRVYFANTKEEIEASGKSTMPERIPGSEFWAYTNENTNRKRELCAEVLRLFRYSWDATAVVRKAFDEIKRNKRFAEDLL